MLQDILNRTRGKQALPWYKTLMQYYYRPQWELYDIRADPAEMKNLHGNIKSIYLIVLFDKLLFTV